MQVNLTALFTDSIKNAASIAAYGMMKHYKGNESGEIPGKIPNTWWEGGAMFMTLMQYYHYTGDSTYNKEVIQGMQWQAGDCDFMPANWSSYIVSSSLYGSPFPLLNEDFREMTIKCSGAWPL